MPGVALPGEPVTASNKLCAVESELEKKLRKQKVLSNAPTSFPFLHNAIQGNRQIFLTIKIRFEYNLCLCRDCAFHVESDSKKVGMAHLDYINSAL